MGSSGRASEYAEGVPNAFDASPAQVREEHVPEAPVALLQPRFRADTSVEISYGDDVASMARGVRNLIPTQADTN